MAWVSSKQLAISAFKLCATRYCANHHPRRRFILSARLSNEKIKQDVSSHIKDLVTQTKAREIFEKEFPSHYQDGKFVSRMSYVEFIDEALAKMKQLGLERDKDAYKELLRVFPVGKYGPLDRDDSGLFHASQQLAAVRVLHQMNINGIRPDKEFERIIIATFSNRSDAWFKIARMNYWSMKGRNLDPHPLPDELPKKPHQIAKVAIARMIDDPKAVLTVTNTSRVPTSIDKTWVVFSQSPIQAQILDSIDEKSTLFIEEGGFAYVDKNYISYHYLKYYVDEATRKKKDDKPAPDFNWNTTKVKFYGKPIQEMYEALRDKHYTDGSYILAIAATGTSSQDSLLSWLKVLQQRNPKLSKLNVVFSQSRSTHEIVEFNQDTKKTASNNDRWQGQQEEDNKRKQASG